MSSIGFKFITQSAQQTDLAADVSNSFKRLYERYKLKFKSEYGVLESRARIRLHVINAHDAQTTRFCRVSGYCSCC